MKASLDEWQRRDPGRLLMLVLLSAALALSGCANMPHVGSGGSAETPAESRMREDSTRFASTVLGGTVAACAVGAIVSALGCKLAGNDASKNRQCALAGCVVLGAAGAADGYYTAKKQQASRDKVRETNAIAADVRHDNQRIQAFLDSSSTVVAESRTKLARLHADTAARRISADQAAAERQNIEQNRDLMQSTVDEMKKSRDVYAGAARQARAAGTGGRELDGEIAQMNQKIAALERNVRTMNSALSVNRS
ncbi:MAG: hypothetical protein ABI699_00520 [Caldimonas sp.]